MIRGINRQIIDVQDTGSTYYERAYLVVKPEFASAERELLEKEARKVLKSMDAPSGMKRANTKLAWFIRLLAAAGLGAGIMAICAFAF
ncbi:MAG: hypothetical protein HFJ84_02410 [Clostridiales bacterium]|nr:hypothetical protein [Clostridiales bacterium]